jgi:hypothetical protein
LVSKGLEKYDEFDQDLRPEDWLRICLESKKVSQARCPIYENGEYVWKPVKVLDYDKESQRFKV